MTACLLSHICHFENYLIHVPGAQSQSHTTHFSHLSNGKLETENERKKKTHASTPLCWGMAEGIRINSFCILICVIKKLSVSCLLCRVGRQHTKLNCHYCRVDLIYLKSNGEPRTANHEPFACMMCVCVCERVPISNAQFTFRGSSHVECPMCVISRQ